MKRYRYISGLMVAAALTMGTVSCSDFLDEPILGQQDLDNYFTTEDECKDIITGCYQTLAYDDWWQIYKFYNASDMCTDDEWMGNTTQDPGEYRDLAHYSGNTINAGNSCQNFWQYRYKGICRCNVAIEHIPQVEFNDEKLRTRYIAEARFLRGFQYFDLVKNFGGLPLVTQIMMPTEIQGITRASLEDTYKFIEDDFKFAIENLPTKAEYAQEDLGRSTSGAAKGFLAKVYLYQGKYEEAEPLLEELCCRGEYLGNTPEYDLMESFADVWSMDHNNNKESLFEIQTNSNTTYGLGERLSVVVGSRDDSGWSWGMPTSDLENAYIAAGDDLDNRKPEFLCEFPVARIMRGNRHDSTRSVCGKHVIRYKNRDLVSVRGIDGEDPLELHARFVLYHFGALKIGFFCRRLAVSGDFRIIGELVLPFIHERMLRRNHHISRAEKRVGSCRINGDFVGLACFKIHLCTIGASDPVDFLRLDALNKIHILQIVDEPVRILGDL